MSIESDAIEAVILEAVDEVHSAGTVQYIGPENRQRQFDRFKANTASRGIHAIFAFVDHLEIPTPTGRTANEYFYIQSELEY